VLLSRISQEEHEYKLTKLEVELNSQLNTARAAASEKRVSDTDIAGSGNVVGAVANFTTCSVCNETATRPHIASRTRRPGRVSDKCWQEWVSKIWMVDYVKEVGAELHINPLRKRSCLVESKIPFFESRPVQ
jgi:hypothetical protein